MVVVIATSVAAPATKTLKEKEYAKTKIRLNKKKQNMGEVNMRTEPKSNFYKLRCTKCKNEQIVFNKVAMKVKCLVCGKLLAEPTGGKTKVKARILEVL